VPPPAAGFCPPHFDAAGGANRPITGAMAAA
jgi:hypothetical protein